MSSVPKGTLDRYYEPKKDARHAAVLILLLFDSDMPKVVFIKRPNHPQDPHSGQISFPGGRVEKNDISYQSAALRETFEEIGVPQDQIKVIGALSKLYVFASNNLVFPFVGYLDYMPDFVLQESEVERVITVPMDFFIDESVLLKKDLQVKGYTLKEVPYYDLYGHTLWGATAMIFAEWLQLWKNSLT